MTKSTFEQNWERAGHFLKEIGTRVAPIGAIVSRGSTATTAAGAAGMDVLARRIRRLSNPSRTRAVSRSRDKSADYLRFRAADDMARDAWRAVNRKPFWITAGTAVGGWIAYRWLSREQH